MTGRPRGSKKGRWFVGALLALAAPGLGAQTPDTLALTLERALEIAEARSPAYRRAWNDVQLNPTETRTMWLERVLPKASLQLFSTAFTGNLAHRATDNFGNPIERPTSEWVYYSTTQQSLNLAWSVQGGSLFQTVGRQRLTNRTRDLARERALSETQLGVRRQYMDVLEQRALLGAEEDLVAERGKDREVVARLFSLAARTRVDVLNAELAVEQQALVAQRQHATFRRSELALRTLLGDDALPPFTLVEEPLPLFDPASLDEEALVRAALGVNPELSQQRAGVEAASLELAGNRNTWWPALGMGLTFTRYAQMQEKGALFDVSLDEELDSRFYVQLSLPMFNSYFGTRERIHQAEVLLDNQREAEREARLGVEQEVRGALLELRSQWESLRLTERSSEIAGEALRLAQEEYRIGTGSFEELRQSAERQAETRRTVIRARHGFVDALLSLQEAVGTEVGPGPAN